MSGTGNGSWAVGEEGPAAEESGGREWGVWLGAGLGSVALLGLAAAVALLLLERRRRRPGGIARSAAIRH